MSPAADHRHIDAATQADIAAEAPSENPRFDSAPRVEITASASPPLFSRSPLPSPAARLCTNTALPNAHGRIEHHGGVCPSPPAPPRDRATTHRRTGSADDAPASIDVQRANPSAQRCARLRLPASSSSSNHRNLDAQPVAIDTSESDTSTHSASSPRFRPSHSLFLLAASSSCSSPPSPPPAFPLRSPRGRRQARARTSTRRTRAWNPRSRVSPSHPPSRLSIWRLSRLSARMHAAKLGAGRGAVPMHVGLGFKYGGAERHGGPDGGECRMPMPRARDEGAARGTAS
ncbi:hypothetical protein DFH09DRAFT_1324992 [Mycena vulgaris]|nr:hypothetical protein DFH09DRAFT_1324992 [Mycena vulgaris]